MIVAKDPQAILSKLEKPKGPYNFKGVGNPKYYLGGDIQIIYEGDHIKTLGQSSEMYITGICGKIEDLISWKLKGLNNLLDPNYHVEINDLDFLVGEDISKYRMMVGSLNWLVTLGRFDIHYTVITLARHMMIPRQGHMYAMKRVFGYLKSNYKFSMKYNTEEPDFSMHKIEDYDWFPLYGEVKEELPYNMPDPKKK